MYFRGVFVAGVTRLVADNRSMRSSVRCWWFAVMAAVAFDGASVSATAPPLPPDDPWIVTDVIDGDTIDVARGSTALTVRLIGINAPESDECWSDEATAALAGFVGSGPVWLIVDTSDVDPFGRALRYVIDADGNDVGGLLVEQGAAIARSYPPDIANDDRYAVLQEAARREGRGLWAADACGPPIDPAVTVEIDVRPNATGDDNINLNDEWVRFTNTGTAPLDIDGWTVRDESSTHRYMFADLLLPPGGSVTLSTGCGTDTPTERFWCKDGSAVWNNSGDTVFLLDPAGNILTSLSY
jgi:micrococcal nuclease